VEEGALFVLYSMILLGRDVDSPHSRPLERPCEPGTYHKNTRASAFTCHFCPAPPLVHLSLYFLLPILAFKSFSSCAAWSVQARIGRMGGWEHP